MLSSGLNIPEIEENDDVYYNRTKEKFNARITRFS